MPIFKQNSSCKGGSYSIKMTTTNQPSKQHICKYEILSLEVVLLIKYTINKGNVWSKFFSTCTVRGKFFAEVSLPLLSKLNCRNIKNKCLKIHFSFKSYAINSQVFVLLDAWIFTIFPCVYFTYSQNVDRHRFRC